MKRLRLMWKRRMLIVYMARLYWKTRDINYLEMMRYRLLEDKGGMWSEA